MVEPNASAVVFFIFLRTFFSARATFDVRVASANLLMQHRRIQHHSLHYIPVERALRMDLMVLGAFSKSVKGSYVVIMWIHTLDGQVEGGGAVCHEIVRAVSDVSPDSEAGA